MPVIYDCTIYENYRKVEKALADIVPLLDETHLINIKIKGQFYWFNIPRQIFGDTMDWDLVDLDDNLLEKTDENYKIYQYGTFIKMHQRQGQKFYTRIHSAVYGARKQREQAEQTKLF